MDEPVPRSSTGKTSLRSSGRRRGALEPPHDCATSNVAMATNVSRGYQSRERPAAPTQNHRVTARTVRDADGTTRTIYHVDGHDVGSIEALEAALRGRR